MRAAEKERDELRERVDDLRPRYDLLRQELERQEAENASLRSQLDEALLVCSGYRNAMENASIAFGMGWDMDGVIDVIRNELGETKDPVRRAADIGGKDG